MTIINRMICRNIVLADKNLLSNLIRSSTDISHLLQTHAQIILNGYRSDIVTVTKLTQKLCDLNSISHATLLCLTFKRPDLFLYNVLIRGLCRNDKLVSAIRVYNHVRNKTRLKPDNFTYAFLVTGITDEKLLCLLHNHVVVNGFAEDMFIASSVVDGYFKHSRVVLALKVFERMHDRDDTVLWNTVVSGLVKNCYYNEAVRIFREMGEERVRHDATTFAAVIPAVAELQVLRVGLGLQCLALKVGLFSYSHVLTALLSLHSKCGDVDMAKLLFEQLHCPDLISYNAMISGYTFNNEIGCSIRLFRQLLSLGMNPNSSTIVGLIPVHFPYGYLNLTSCIHAFSFKSGIFFISSVSTALTTVYSRLNEIDVARKLFDESPEKTLASWNAMISGYTQNGLTEEAITLFKEMQRSEIHPNPTTVTSILSACAQLGALSLGKWVHDLIKTENFETNVYVTTSLIDMYAKCGSIMEARLLFDQVPEKNVVTCNAMISGYGLHGHGHEALKLFTAMSDSGISPNEVTFLSVLYACSHAGLVREGDEIFRSMINHHGVQPLPEHYACMVDILGRAGKIKKAMEFIETMPVEPGCVVWGAVLGACMIHKENNLARVVSDKLFKLDPENIGYYVLLSNIFSSERNYSEAASVRHKAKNKQLAKTPGCTLIEVGGTPHVFTSGDRSHPQAMEIYAKLEDLMGRMREAGFQTETATALHDIEQEEKELAVNVHSEKLAIAFGLIVSKPGTEIRIIKNLRVCLDCHTATKFISQVTKRVIVVRDANRFHHFSKGVCSCGDYW